MNDSMNMSNMTALGRPIDPRNFTNLLILILTPVVGGIALGFALASGVEFELSARIGFTAAMITFLTWILGREADPDHPWSAFLSVALVLIAYYFIQRNFLAAEEPRLIDTAILSLLMAINVMRLVSRIVGPPAQLVDSVLTLVLVAAVAFLGTWPVAIAGALAFLLDGLMPKANRRNLLFALLSAVVIAARLVILEVGEPGNLTLPYLVVITVITVAYGATIIATRELKHGCDVKEYDLDVRRVRAAMLMGLVIALIASIWDGNAGVLKTMPLWAALLGSALYRLPVTIFQFRNAGKAQSVTAEAKEEPDAVTS